MHSLPSVQELWVWNGLCVLSIPMQQHHVRLNWTKNNRSTLIFLVLIWTRMRYRNTCRCSIVNVLCNNFHIHVYLLHRHLNITSIVWLSLLWNKHFSSCVGWEPGAFWFHRLVGHFEPCTMNCSSLTLLSCWNNRGELGESKLGIKEASTVCELSMMFESTTFSHLDLVSFIFSWNK